MSVLKDEMHKKLNVSVNGVERSTQYTPISVKVASEKKDA